MLRPLLAVAAIATCAHAAELSRFHVVSVFFSDNGALFYYRIIDVQPDGPGSLVRYIRVAPSNVYCPRKIIQAAESRVPNKSPAQLAGANNPCAVKPARLNTAIRKYRQRAGTFETISFGLVASCDGKSVQFSLPITDTLKFDDLKSREPALARLWDFASEIETSVFGPKDLFHDRTESDDLAFQRAARRYFPK
jgi:hypothetical protein